MVKRPSSKPEATENLTSENSNALGATLPGTAQHRGQPKLSRDTTKKLGQALGMHWSHLLREPVPQHLLDLVRRLNQQEAADLLRQRNPGAQFGSAPQLEGEEKDPRP